MSAPPGRPAEATETTYRCPTHLTVSPLRLKRVLVIGSCMTVAWPPFIRSVHPGCECDFLLMNNAPRFPEIMPAPPQDYDFQIVQIPLRILVPERAYFRLSYADHAAYEALFDNAVLRLRQFLNEGMRWNTEHGLLTFVFNFLPPQQNPLGRLLPRYDLRNFVFFVEKLNQVLSEEVARYQNAHVFDFDQVVATFGRKYLQDDGVYHTGHASVLSNYDFDKDQARIEPVARMNAVYPLRAQAYLAAGWAELEAVVRTIRQMDMVKLVIVDIDDTIWRGVAAERAEVAPQDLVEGWPLGFIEALLCVKRRGVLLAIVSKNDEATVSALWQSIVGKMISLDDFAVRKINWRPKADNVEDILREVNLLARNTVFIDDNPVERDAVCAAFPAIRAFGPNPYVWRRLLLWSAETQVAGITGESATRTTMVQAQITREVERKQMSREDFLASLDVRVEVFGVGADDAAFPRLFELLNKTNQFNTTGKRWSRQDCLQAMGRGARFHAFKVTDRFTEYGLVGVVVIDGAAIVQFVMSCRVVGMDVEIAVLAALLDALHAAGHASSEAWTEPTEFNLLSRDLFARAGFAERSGGWSRALGGPLEMPRHVRMALGAAPADARVA